jgi:hypothetical protein
VESGIQGVGSGIQVVGSGIQIPPGLPHMGRILVKRTYIVSRISEKFYQFRLETIGNQLICVLTHCMAALSPLTSKIVWH